MFKNVEKNDSGVAEVENTDDNKSIPTSKKGKLIALRSESEKTKAWIVKALLIIFGSTVGCCFLLIAIEIVFPSTNKEDFKDIVTSILVAQTAIIGTVLGFYFGDRSKS